jgi:hypothetical protein
MGWPRSNRGPADAGPPLEHGLRRRVAAGAGVEAPAGRAVDQDRELRAGAVQTPPGAREWDADPAASPIGQDVAGAAVGVLGDAKVGKLVVPRDEPHLAPPNLRHTAASRPRGRGKSCSRHPGPVGVDTASPSWVGELYAIRPDYEGLQSRFCRP